MFLFFRSCAAALFSFLFLIETSSAQEKLSLQQALDAALANNPDVLSAQKEIAITASRILQAGRFANPELTFMFNETPTSFSFGNAGEKDIGLSQTLEFPGKRGARIKVASHDKAIAELALRRTRTVVASQVKRAYYQALLADEVIDNLQFTLGLLEDFLKTVTERYQTGASRYLDVIRTKVELTRLRNDAVEAQRDYQLQLAELNVLLGRADETEAQLADSLAYQPFPISQDAALALYEKQSAFLQIAEREASRSQAVLRLAQKSYLPDFNLGLALQNRATAPNSSSSFFGFGLGVSVPLWFWQAPRGETQEAHALVDLGTLRLEAARRLVRQKILSAHRVASVADQQVRVFETSLLQDAEDELRAGIAAYQNNQIDALNLFDIYRTYRATKIEYARALYNYLAALAELEAAGEVFE